MDEDQSLEIEITDGGYSEEEINAAAEAQRKAQEQQQQYSNDLKQQDLQNKQAQEQLLVEQEKNRKANLGDYIKDTGVGVVAGVQDTASSLITMPERIIDYFT